MHQAVEDFKSLTLSRCFQFCKYHRDCALFTFISSAERGRCLLFPAKDWSPGDIRQGSVGMVTVSKECMMGRECGGTHNTLEQLVKTSQTEGGFYIWDRRTRKCLAPSVFQWTKWTGGSLGNKTGQTRTVRWRACRHEKVVKWVLISKGPAPHPGFPVRSLSKGRVAQRVVITPLDLATPALKGSLTCLGWSPSQGVVIDGCKHEQNREIQLIFRDLVFQRCRTSLSAHSDEPASHLPVEFRQRRPALPRRPLWEQTCSVKNSSVPHGHLVQEEGVPFQLPSENITVRCGARFGANQRGLVREWSVPCRHPVHLLTCVRLPPKTRVPLDAIVTIVPVVKKPRDKRDPFFVSTIFLGTFITVLLLFIGGLAFYYHRKANSIRDHILLQSNLSKIFADAEALAAGKKAKKRAKEEAARRKQRIKEFRREFEYSFFSCFS